MDTIQIKDKKFRLSIPESEIQAAVKKVAEQINHDITEKKPGFYLCFEWCVYVCRRLDEKCKYAL